MAATYGLLQPQIPGYSNLRRMLVALPFDVSQAANIPLHNSIGGLEDVTRKDFIPKDGAFGITSLGIWALPECKQSDARLLADITEAYSITTSEDETRAIRTLAMLKQRAFRLHILRYGPAADIIVAPYDSPLSFLDGVLYSNGNSLDMPPDLRTVNLSLFCDSEFTVQPAGSLVIRPSDLIGYPDNTAFPSSGVFSRALSPAIYLKDEEWVEELQRELKEHPNVDDLVRKHADLLGLVNKN